MSKKILLVSNMYPSKKFPHYGVFVKNTEEILKHAGYDISLVVLTKSTSKAEKIFKYFFFYLKIILFGLFLKYDYIYAHYASHTSFPLLFLKRIKPKTKIVMNVHGNDIVPEDKKDEKYIKFVKKILDKSFFIVSPSNYFSDILVNKYFVDNSKIVVYPSGGINIELFRPMDMSNSKKELCLDINTHYIGMVSRIEKNKGWDVFLDAIKMLDSKLDSSYKFIIVGSGVELGLLKEKIVNYGISTRIVLMDFLDHNKLPFLYNSLDIFCFPTYRKSESLGLVGLEAMACGDIIISSDKFGPTSYIVDGVNGFSFVTKNSVSLQEKILEIIDLPESKKVEIKKQAINTAKTYSIGETNNIIIDLFK